MFSKDRFLNFNSFNGSSTINRLYQLNDSTNSYNSEMFIIHQNIHSVRKNFEGLIIDLSTFQILPDLIFVTEILIYCNEVGDFLIPGYTFHAITNNIYASGGTGVFINIISFLCFMGARILLILE